MSGPGPQTAVYFGATTHARLTPFHHAFTYDLAALWLDPDAPKADARTRAFAVDRPGLLSYRSKDHGRRRTGEVGAWARETFAAAGVPLEGGPVRLLCLPRLFGFGFKPLSVLFGYGPQGDWRGVIYEVRNTFGDRHSYVAPAEDTGAPTRQSVDKIFHVSPFFDRGGRYVFDLKAPDERLALKIRWERGDGLAFTAAWTGDRAPLDDAAAARLLIGRPFQALGVSAAIHWEALKLWIKGARYHDRPPPPDPGHSVGRLERPSVGPR
ncbi:MAG: DUF1365 domain-containing protein [Maricaulaceae bacterium]